MAAPGYSPATKKVAPNADARWLVCGLARTGDQAMMRNNLIAALAFGATAATAQTPPTLEISGGGSTARPTILLIHGGFVDGSGWERVFTRLKKDGYAVSIVQNPTTSLADDVAVTRRAIEASSGPVILVG